jgi:hypothetical protein
MTPRSEEDNSFISKFGGLRNKKTIKVILTKNSDHNIGLEFFLYFEKIEFIVRLIWNYRNRI